MAATRHSGLECLRIISIILIVSMHILGNTFHTSNSVSYTHLDVYKRQVHDGKVHAKHSPSPFIG